jgi:hypothetical protein
MNLVCPAECGHGHRCDHPEDDPPEQHQAWDPAEDVLHEWVGLGVCVPTDMATATTGRWTA